MNNSHYSRQNKYFYVLYNEDDSVRAVYTSQFAYNRKIGIYTYPMYDAEYLQSLEDYGYDSPIDGTTPYTVRFKNCLFESEV